MDFIIIMIIIAVLFSIIGGIIWYVFLFLAGRAMLDVKGNCQ